MDKCVKKILEQVMSDFHHHRFQILICTTIIESGIDIPAANTIIIDRADKFGLAQLHQLRGRVGRSSHQAYAYLLIPPLKALKSDAKKRLKAISTLNELGIGFSLATHDLEIRGAGELLGAEQSGHISNIGFTLYQELLERAVCDLKANKDLMIHPVMTSIKIQLPLNALIPEQYLFDPHLRLVCYKRIASCQTDAELLAIKMELIDRFGELPIETEQLLQVTALKRQAQQLEIKSIIANKTSNLLIEFASNTPVTPETILHLLQTNKNIQIRGSHKIVLTIGKGDTMLTQLKQLLTQLLNTF